MAAFYTYLISSLPTLAFGVKPEFSLEQFLTICRDLIPEKDWQILDFCGRGALLEQNLEQPILKQWIEFETGLANELVKVRSSYKKIDPEKYLRQIHADILSLSNTSESALQHIALNSHRIPSLVEAEKFLDQQRWLKLEELCFGHYFDLDALLIYCLKLRILWRWENIARADKQAQLTEVLTVS